MLAVLRMTSELQLIWHTLAAKIVIMTWVITLLYALFTGVVFRADRAAQAQLYDQAATVKLAERQAARLQQESASNTAINTDPNAGFPSRLRSAAVLPPAPLSFLAVGQQDLQPFTAAVTLLARPDNLLKARHELANPAALAAGRFDLVFAVVFLMPLAMIALSYGQFAGDRERGRLSLIAVQRGTLLPLLAWRLGIRFCLVALPLVVITGVATFVMAGPAQWVTWLQWLLPALAWLLLWTGLCALFAANSRSAGSAALTLAATWLLLVLVSPIALNATLQWLAPSPSKVALAGEVRTAERDAATQATQLLGNFLHDHPELDKNAPDGPAAWTRGYYAQQQAVGHFVAAAKASQQARLDANRELANWLQYLSPAAALQQALVDAAGSGDARYAAFITQLNDYKKRWDDALRLRLFEGKMLSSAEIAALPHFKFVEARAVSTVYSFSYLLITAGIVFFLCLIVLRRLKSSY